jgi:hypothetical protein
MSLCTLQEIKDWLKITDNSQDAILTSTQAAVEAAVKAYVDTDFTTTTKTELLDGSRSDTIVLEGYPIISVSAIYFYPNTSGAEGSLVDLESYIVKPEAIYLTNLYTPAGRGKVRVDYTYGYASVPDDVKMAVKLGVEAFMARRARKTVGVGSRSKEGESESFVSAWDKKSGLPVEVTGLLQIYRTYEVPVISLAQRNR